MNDIELMPKDIDLDDLEYFIRKVRKYPNNIRVKKQLLVVMNVYTAYQRIKMDEENE